jgi:hypothetical protein
MLARREAFWIYRKIHLCFVFIKTIFPVRNELERPVLDVKKFMEKVCPHNVNKRMHLALLKFAKFGIRLIHRVVS